MAPTCTLAIGATRVTEVIQVTGAIPATIPAAVEAITPGPCLQSRQCRQSCPRPLQLPPQRRRRCQRRRRLRRQSRLSLPRRCRRRGHHCNSMVRLRHPAIHPHILLHRPHRRQRRYQLRLSLLSRPRRLGLRHLLYQHNNPQLPLGQWFQLGECPPWRRCRSSLRNLKSS